ncbi:restriction endonuclease subunit S, partial [Flavobacteriaceae bacterium]|nr:restriction endonuclease subunit S [Flavobacteriaceae bacterium]
MQYSVVRYSEVLNSSYRFDSEYWVADVINYNKQFKTLSDLNIKVVSGPFGSSLKSEAYCNSGVPFVRISDLNNFFISKDNLIHISEEDHKRLSSSRLKYNDLILSKVGNTIGVVSILTPEIGYECNISENNLGIRLWNNDLKINPYFLLSYLNCKIGQKQILRLISGNAQPKLNVADIKNLKLPIILDLFQLRIEELVKNSYKISNSSKSLYNEAENLLLEELNLKDWKPKHQLSYVKSYSDTQKAERFDAEYFQPQYDEIIEKVKNIQNDDLGNIVKWSKGIEVGSEQYIDEGFDFVRISDFNTKGISEASKKISKELFLELKDKFSPKKGDILFTKDGTIGLTYLVNQDQNSIISGAFLK